jgi:cell division inhibitor SepF
MSVFRKAMVYLGLVDDDEYYGDDGDYYDDDTYEEHPDRAERAERPERSPRAASPAPSPESTPVTVIRGNRHRDEEPSPAAAAPAPMARSSAVTAVPAPAARVHVMEPRGFNDAQEVGDRLKAGQPVILNLQGVDRDLQRRLIDFSSGLAYALSGTMSKAADQVFLLTPSNVEVSEEEKERLQARGLYRAARA